MFGFSNSHIESVAIPLNAFWVAVQCSLECAVRRQSGWMHGTQRGWGSLWKGDAAREARRQWLLWLSVKIDRKIIWFYMFYAKVRATKNDCTRTGKVMQQTGNISNGRPVVACASMRRDTHCESRFMNLCRSFMTGPKATSAYINWNRVFQLNRPR